MFDTTIENGEVLLPGAVPQRLTIAIRDGRIAALTAPGETVEARERIDASGKLVLPGVIDVHLHLGSGADIARPRVPDDAALETAGAAKGGVTTIVPYLMGAKDYAQEFDELISVTEAGARTDFSYHPIISTEEQLAQVPAYVQLGMPSFKIFMNNRRGEGARLGLPDIDDGFLYRLAELCADYGGLVCPHPENVEVNAVLRERLLREDPEGKSGLAGWNASRPPLVEAEAIQRAGMLAGGAGAPIYFVHTSSREALEAALRLRDAGVDVTIETCPQYLTHDVTSPIGDLGKVNPPLRTPEDREALWAAIHDGSVDTIATDHVHRHVSAKAGGIWKASPGFPGVETFLPVMLSEGHVKRGVSLSRIVSLLCEKPARTMGLWGRKGGIVPGFDADLAIIDLSQRWTPTNDTVSTSAGYSLYDGVELTGKVVHTFLRGKQTVVNGELVETSRGEGRFVRRVNRVGSRA